MFENTIKNVTAGRQEMFDDGLKMYEEMCPNDDLTKCAQAREAWFAMGNLRTAYQDFDHSNCGLTLTDLAENIKQYNKFEQQSYTYCRALAPYLRGDEKDRLNALMQADFVIVNGVKESLNTAAKNFNLAKESMVYIRERIEVIEQTLTNKKYLIYQCHKQLKEIYDRFKADQAAQQKLKEKKPQQKHITVLIDTSWPMSPREIQQAIDTLKAFKPEGEDGIGLKSAVETLESFKKSVEKDIEKKTTVKEEGHIFKLSTAE